MKWLLGIDQNKKQLATQAKKIAKLEKTVDDLSVKLDDAQKKIADLSKLLTVSLNAQAQMSIDMNTIYESIVAVSESLNGPAPADDEKYFKWRWNISDDDDDLPN